MPEWLMGKTIWSQLHRMHYHVVSQRFQRYLRRQKASFSIFPFVIAMGFISLGGLSATFSRFGVQAVLTFPLWLMVFSGSYVIVWIYRITTVLAEQRRSGSLSSLNTIPAGRFFVSLAICHAVLNKDDALVWIRMLRHLVVGVILYVLMMVIMVTLTQIDTVELAETATIIFDIGVIVAVVYAEHRQSVLLGCLTAITLPRATSNNDSASIAILGFVALQVATFAVPALIAIAVQMMIGREEPLIAVAFLLFIILREGLVNLLWWIVSRHD
ncbi:MAG: hypothetical protein KC546_11540 [Anaerolineae bacterium]|nr:hypothetical protein [Anaerolineae bacterium]MCB9458995.1 hypothetical protein [Anaerolineaceae bacterium]